MTGSDAKMPVARSLGLQVEAETDDGSEVELKGLAPTLVSSTKQPCLRRGEFQVHVGLAFTLFGQSTPIWLSFEALLFLAIRSSEGRPLVCYQRCTLRYPLALYDENPGGGYASRKRAARLRT